jgi:ABC-type bacteriocin/lantibiotic exporter with double-glycine peptidase domain
MYGLLQPAHLIFISITFLPLLAIVWVWYILFARRIWKQADKQREVSAQQNKILSELVLSLEKINSTLERIEHKLEPLRKGD